MRVVLDTNVVVSTALTPSGTCDTILRAAFRGNFFICTSENILEEYAEVLARPSLKLPPAASSELLNFFKTCSLCFPDTHQTQTLPDPDDEMFLATALTAKADFLITGNLKHFPPHLRRGITVLTPAQFLKYLTPRP